MFRNTELTPVTEENAADFDGLLEEEKEQKKGTEKKEQKKGTEKKEQKKGTEKKEQKKGIEIIERTEKIWELICNDPSITQSAMMEALGISRKKVQLVLDKLVADGKIERVGSDRSGSWKII